MLKIRVTLRAQAKPIPFMQQKQRPSFPALLIHKYGQTNLLKLAIFIPNSDVPISPPLGVGWAWGN